MKVVAHTATGSTSERFAVTSAAHNRSKHIRSLVVFSHGKETGPWGIKIKHLASIAQVAGWQVLSVDYAEATGQRDAPAADRLAALLAQPLAAHNTLALVGSSMGGWVSAAACAALQPQGLFLMAPALDLPGCPAIDTNAWREEMDKEVVHGWRDDVVPPAGSIRLAQQKRARLHLLDDDHRLGATLPEIGWLFGQFLARLQSALPDSANQQIVN